MPISPDSGHTLPNLRKALWKLPAECQNSCENWKVPGEAIHCTEGLLRLRRARQPSIRQRFVPAFSVELIGHALIVERYSQENAPGFGIHPCFANCPQFFGPQAIPVRALKTILLRALECI